MADHSLILNTGNKLIFAWCVDGEWRTEERPRQPGDTALLPAKSWRRPLSDWPTPRTVLETTLVSMEAELVNQLAQEGTRLEHDETQEVPWSA